MRHRLPEIFPEGGAAGLTPNGVQAARAPSNFDSQHVTPNTPGAKPRVVTPAIPLAWPTGVGFGKDRIYVNDTYNRRVVRVDWTWALDKTLAVK